MGWPARIFVVRHGQSIGNIVNADTKMKTGTNAYPLTELGKIQVKMMASALRIFAPHGFHAQYQSKKERR